MVGGYVRLWAISRRNKFLLQQVSHPLSGLLATKCMMTNLAITGLENPRL